MSQALSPATVQVAAAAGSPPSLGVPELNGGVIARPRLERQLRAAGNNALVVVEGPMGSGKTLGVARWAADESDADGVLWLDAGRLDAGRGADDREQFWSRLRSGLTLLGVGPIAAMPTSSAALLWARWLAALADAINGAGRWLLVLDDFPTGPVGSFGRQIAALLAQTTGLQLVITCNGAPALDLARFRAARRCARIGFEALRMAADEVLEMLVRRGLAADGTTVASVRTITDGWALGVDLAARMLTTPADTAEVLSGLEGTLSDVIEAEVLTQLPAAARELIVRTSVVSEVAAGVSLAIMGEDVAGPEPWIGDARGLVELLGQGGWRCHPLLRRAARRRLDDDWPALSRQARRAAAQWHVEYGDRSAGIALAAEVEDWEWVTRALVRSLAVPTFLFGTPDSALADVVSQVQIKASEPLIVAAAAVAENQPDIAEAALSSPRETIVAGPDSLPYALTEAIIRMAIARARADAQDGLAWVNECRRLAAELSPRQRESAAELSDVLAAHEAAFLITYGDLAQAVRVVGPAEFSAIEKGKDGVAGSERIGLLAWLCALRGELTAAGRRAAEVLRIRPADSDEVGVGYAQLATAWVHLERGELDQAGQRLDHSMCFASSVRDPWLVAAQWLATARLSIHKGEPEVAVRLLTDVRRTSPAAKAGWLADRCTVALAEAHLAVGDAQRALAVLTPEPRHTLVEARVVAAGARHAIGDRRGARALLSAIRDALADAPLPAAVQVWCLEAQLISDAGEAERAHGLVSMGLRTAEREGLRSALAPVSHWLLVYVNRHPDLWRRHREFLSSPMTSMRNPSAADVAEPSTPALLEPLTERELQVLERMAQFFTTEEIAGNLYVSVNTVKTHIKSLFLKLSVNRRADAVRRGRRLGLC